ncbi:hypothetical protein ABCW43_19480 [Neorhizobium sp. IRAMC:178]|uniref:hypothetical protein n=1 Tax=Neorhizobium tunisiense TaxID=3144793 RepID=UPI0031F6DE34
MYTRLCAAVAAAMNMAGSVSAAEMGRSLVSADPLTHRSPAVFPQPAIASVHGISNGLADPPGTSVRGPD